MRVKKQASLLIDSRLIIDGVQTLFTRGDSGFCISFVGDFGGTGWENIMAYLRMFDVIFTEKYSIQEKLIYLETCDNLGTFVGQVSFT